MKPRNQYQSTGWHVTRENGGTIRMSERQEEEDDGGRDHDNLQNKRTNRKIIKTTATMSKHFAPS